MSGTGAWLVILKAKVGLKVDWYPRVLQFIVSIIKEWVDHFLVQALIERVLHLCRSGGVRVPGE